MVDCMLLGEGLTGDANTRAHWANDDLSECPNEDALWGFAIHASGELERSSREKVDDSVLYCLFHMGLFDWPGRNKLQEGNISRSEICRCDGHQAVCPYPEDRGEGTFSFILSNQEEVIERVCYSTK